MKKRPKERNYLVFGASGQVGAELTRRYEGSLTLCKAREAVDITDFKAVQKLLRSAKPAAVLNVAGMNDRQIRLDNKTARSAMWRSNVDAVDHLARCCAMYGYPFVQLSSDEVFGGDELRVDPLRELDVVHPANYYGMTKLAAEHAVLNVGQLATADVAASDFNYIVVRTSLPYEPLRKFRNTFINNMAGLASKRQAHEEPVPSDVIRSPTFVPHLCDHLMWLLDHVQEVPAGVYHIANHGEASLYEIARHIVKVTDSVTTIRASSRAESTYSYMPQYTALNCQKWMEICPLPLPTWEEGIEAFCRNYRSARLVG